MCTHKKNPPDAKDTQINKGRHFEAKGQRHHEEVECPDVVDLFE